MYVGRIVGVGRTREGLLVAAYRVSSRSFPNRDAERSGNSVRIVARSGSADAKSDSPYIAYECLVCDDRFAVVSNGAHTRPIFERLKSGHSPRDAVLGVLSGLDREFDEYDTPRICGLFDSEEDSLWLGSVTAKALSVAPIEVKAGQMAYVTTYGFPLASPSQVDLVFGAKSADEICKHITYSSVFAEFEKPICAAVVMGGSQPNEIGILNF
jgi:IMP cyclohydrolase